MEHQKDSKSEEPRGGSQLDSLRVSDFVVSRTMLDPSMTAEDVERLFHARVDVESAVVVWPDGSIGGAIQRRRFLMQLSGRFGHALFGQRPIVEIMEHNFLCVPAAMTLTQLSGRLSTRVNEFFYDDVIVDFGNGGFGTAPVRNILQAIQNVSSQIHSDLLTVQDENRRLQNQAEIRWEMISSLSHELRTPLATISGYAELAEYNLDKPAELKTNLTKIRESANELLGHIHSVLEMARAAAGRLELTPERFDLREEVQIAASQCEVLTRGRSIRVSFGIPPEPVLLYADRRKLKQVLVNLIGNAAKFTQSGTIALHLRVAENTARLSVSDTGPGIAADKIQGLFQRFERVGDRSVEGSGLGLSIVKALVEAQGGTVDVESIEGEGTTFVLSYPLFPEGKHESDVL